jgi:predicted transcriptional regulator
VAAEYGPVPLEMVAEYLRALERIGVVERVK